MLTERADLRLKLLESVVDKTKIDMLASVFGVSPAKMSAWIIGAEQPPRWLSAEMSPSK